MVETLTVADVLDIPEVVAGAPELIAGSAGLSRAVRWAHVVAGTDVVHLLDGDELVLTTGAGWPQDPDGLSSLAHGLIGASPAAIMLELGRNFAEPPSQLIEVCEAHAVPLIVLGRETRFVQITQRLHQYLLASQHQALQARAEVHDMLTDLGLNRSPVDYVIDRLAETLDAPVVLENSAGQVVAWSGHVPTSGAEHPLEGWVSMRDGAELAPHVTPPHDWVRVPVEAQGKRWGALTALPGPEHPAGRRTVLELGAFALALGRLADPEGEQWLQLASKQLVNIMLDGRYRHEHDLAIQLSATGLPIEERTLIGATLRSSGTFGTAGPLERTVLETALRRAVAPEGRVLIATDPGAADTGSTLLVLLSFPPEDPRGDTSAADVPPLAERFAEELDMLIPATTPAAWQAHLTLGPPGTRLRTLISSLEQVRAAGDVGPSMRTGRVTVRAAEQQPLAHLVRTLASTPEVQGYVDEVLGPLIAHDAARGSSGDLLRVLEVYLKHPTNRSLAAKQARFSRSIFYQRLAQIEELLDVDLADGDTIATLSVALLARS